MKNVVLRKAFLYNTLFTVFILFTLFAVHIAFAQQVNLIEPLPGGQTLTRGTGLLTSYLGLVFRLTLSAAAILALLFIVLGGVRYTLTSISPSEKGAAKDMIFNAIWGLLIVLLAYLVLYTINPDFVNFNFSLPTVATTGPAPGPGGPGGPGPGPGPLPPPPGTTIPNPQQEAANRQLFASSCFQQGTGSTCSAGSSNCNCISINNAPCPAGSTGSGCTTVGGLQQNTINGTIEINQQCNANTSLAASPCTMVITGGNEPGHSGTGVGTHAGGYKVDYRPTASLDAYIIANTTQVGSTVIGGQTVPIRQGTLPSGQQIRVLDERNTSAPHWDVEFL